MRRIILSTAVCLILLSVSIIPSNVGMYQQNVKAHIGPDEHSLKDIVLCFLVGTIQNLREDEVGHEGVMYHFNAKCCLLIILLVYGLPIFWVTFTGLNEEVDLWKDRFFGRINEHFILGFYVGS